MVFNYNLEYMMAVPWQKVPVGAENYFTKNFEGLAALTDFKGKPHSHKNIEK